MVWYQDILGNGMSFLQTGYLKYPWVLFIIIPLFFVTWWALRRDFVKLNEDEDKPILQAIRRQQQKAILFTRTIIFILLLIALATPYVEQTKVIEGEPF